MKDDLLMQSRERHRLLCGDAAIVTAAELALLDAIAESAEMNTNTQSYWNWVRKQKYPRSMQLAADAVDLFGQQWLQEKASCELVQGRIETACQPEKLRHLAGILIDVAFTVAPNIGEDEIKDLRGIISELTALAHDCTDVSETKLTASCGTCSIQMTNAQPTTAARTIPMRPSRSSKPGMSISTSATRSNTSVAIDTKASRCAT